jgi:hypothetical protein
MRNFYEVIDCYQKVLSGTKKRFDNGFFEDGFGKEYLAWMTRFLIESCLRIPIEEIPDKVSAQILWSHRLRPGAKYFDFKFLEVIENAYPNRFLPNEFKQVPHGYWQGEEGKKRGIELVKYIIEEKCNIPVQDIPNVIDHHFFKKNRLLGIFEIFDSSPFKVVDAVYPDKNFKSWQFENAPINSWNNEQIIKEAMDSFIFDTLNYLSYDEAYEQIKKRQFFEYKLTGIYQQAFNSRLSRVKEWILKQSNSSGVL